MYQESKMKANIISRNSNGTKDGGLMQLNSAYHKSRAKAYNITNFNVLNPQQNILMAVRLINDLESNFIDKGYYDDSLVFAVLGSYNMGEDGYLSYIKRRHKQPSYVWQVLAYKEQLETINTFSDFS
jgi:membrane-bound lytic murein transglycosylase MltF